MAMVVISDWVMACMDCGGFHFLAKEIDNQRVVKHPDSEMYQIYDRDKLSFSPCPNIGKRFAFPETGPTLAIEID